MRNNIATLGTLRNLLFLLLLLLTTLFLPFAARGQIAVRGETIWTMTGEPIKNGVVLLNNGKIEAVGTEAQVTIPANYKVVSAKVVTPGLIDARTVVGLSGYLNQPHDQMQLETSGPLQPELRAIDSYNPDERLIEWLRGFGITTIHTGHGPGALISGQTMVAKTWGKTVEEATLIPTAMVAANLGADALAGQGRSPGTRAKQAALLRIELLKAEAAMKRADAPRELRSEMFIRLLKREIPLMVTANRSQDIMTALRIAKEFNLRLVLDGAAESYLVMNEIKAAGISVIVHPAQQRAGGDTENLSMETASKLKQAGIPIALQSGFEGYVPKTRVVLFEAAVAAANGLGQRDALAAITIDAAKLLGLENRLGSIAVGKEADLALFDGDPFEYTSHCVGTIINGQVVNNGTR
jgi:imidazolonepropionase-like amidohydrolase